MIVIRSTLFNLWFFGSLLVTLLTLWVFLPLPPRFMHWGVRVWSRGVMVGMRLILGLTYEVRGSENLSRAGSRMVVACKHQSIWDTIIFHLIFDDPVYVMKKELMAIPLWGWYARKCESVAVDRGAGASALKSMVRGVAHALDAGHPIVVFPEGTRTEPGTRHPLHPGIAAIYTQTGPTVVPAALNSGFFWGRRRFLKKPGHIVLEFLTPIGPGLDRRAFMAELEDRIEAASARLAPRLSPDPVQGG